MLSFYAHKHNFSLIKIILNKLALHAGIQSFPASVSSWGLQFPVALSSAA